VGPSSGSSASRTAPAAASAGSPPAVAACGLRFVARRPGGEKYAGAKPVYRPDSPTWPADDTDFYGRTLEGFEVVTTRAPSGTSVSPRITSRVAPRTQNMMGVEYRITSSTAVLRASGSDR